MTAKTKTKKPKATARPRKKPEPPAGPVGKEVDFPIDMITREPELQPRKGDGKGGGNGLYADHVQDMRGAVADLAKRKELPRVRIWAVGGRGNLLTDGHHTVKAYELEGMKKVPALVFEGSWLDAVADANREDPHKALKRTAEERRTAVINLLTTLRKEGENWSMSRVAKWCGVGDDLVKACVLRLPPDPKAASGPKLGSDGKKYAAKHGANPKPKPATGKAPRAEPEPEAATPAPEPKAEPVIAEIKAIPTPTSSDTKTQPDGQAFDVAAFEAKVGAVDREIDNLGNLYGAAHVPRAEFLRRLLREFKAGFLEWNKELVARRTEKNGGMKK
jgi:hypothetical protein